MELLTDPYYHYWSFKSRILICLVCMVFVMWVSEFFVICVYIPHIWMCNKNKRKKDRQTMHDKTPPKCNLKLRALNRSSVVTATVKICFIFCCFSNIDWFVKCFGKRAVDEPRCHRGVVLQLEDKKPFLNHCMAALALASEYCVIPVSAKANGLAQNGERHKIPQINKPGLRMQ